MSVSILVLLVVLSLWAGDAQAQATAVCSDTPATGERIECTEDAMSTAAIDIDAEGVDIDTTADNESGITASHAGTRESVLPDSLTAKIDIDVTYKVTGTEVTQSDIDTTGAGSHGVEATHTGVGNVSVFTRLGEITTTGAGSHGIYVEHTGATGDVTINAGSTTLLTEGLVSRAIHAETEATGRLDVDVGGGSITTTGLISRGVSLRHEGVGAIDLDVLRDTTIRTTGYSVFAEHHGTGDVMVTFEEGVDIETSGGSGDGIHGDHRGVGDITINVQGTSEDHTITTSGNAANGVVGDHQGQGSVDITVNDVEITTTGGPFTQAGAVRSAMGVHGRHSQQNDDLNYEDTYNVKVDVRESQIDTQATAAYGVSSVHEGKDLGSRIARGKSEIIVRNTDIVTAGRFARGIYAVSFYSAGDMTITVDGGSVTTAGSQAPGIRAKHGSGVVTGESGHAMISVTDAEITTQAIAMDGSYDSKSIEVQNRTDGAGDASITMVDTIVTSHKDTAVQSSRLSPGTGDIIIDITGGKVTAKGRNKPAVVGFHLSQGDIDIKLRDAAITTESTETSNGLTLSHGLYALRWNSDPENLTGAIRIDARGGSITTKGAYSYGIYARNHGAGTDDSMRVETHDGHKITTTGPNGHGIVAYQRGSGEERIIDVRVGGNVDASGAGAQGVRVGAVSGGAPDRVAARDADGYRQQTVTVNGSVMGNAAGVYLAGGGRVVIGPQGSIGAESGIAILATGTVPEVPAPDPNPDMIETILAIPPKLRVDLNLDGRRVAQAIGDDWIINDGGETTILVNDVKLHDGADGIVEDAVAPNGAWNVSMTGAGVNVTDYTDPDPADWTTETATTAAGRDFSTSDFIEEAASTCPAGQVGTPPNCTTPPQPQPTICPAGQVGTPPNCTTPPRPQPTICPAGQVGTPPNCTTPPPPPPPICPEGQVGTPPDCTTPPPPPPTMCPAGQVGTPPDCTTPPPPPPTMCPAGQVGTPPDCTTPPPPPPTMCPAGQVGTPPDCTTPPKPVFEGSGSTAGVFIRGGGRVVKYVFGGLLDAAADLLEASGPAAGETAAGVIDGRYSYTENLLDTPGPNNLHEVYAPRAAVYEALPGFLLRLNGGGPDLNGGGPEGERLRSPGSPVWAKLPGGRGGSYESEGASVGAEYDFTRFTAQAGLDVGMSERFTGSISVRHVSGFADVSAPTGGGEVEAKGIGVSLGASWKGAGGWYANGSLSLTDYDVELASGDTSVGTLQQDAAARGNSLGIEAGRRIEMNAKMSLTPRAWMTRSEVSINTFTDSTGARFSLDDARRLTGGVGVVAETARAWDGGTFSLRGSVDVGHKLGDAETAVDVSGERLASESAETRFLFGLGGVYREGRFSVSGEVSVGGIGSGDTQSAGRVSIGVRF